MFHYIPSNAVIDPIVYRAALPDPLRTHAEQAGAKNFGSAMASLAAWNISLKGRQADFVSAESRDSLRYLGFLQHKSVVPQVIGGVISGEPFICYRVDQLPGNPRMNITHFHSPISWNTSFLHGMPRSTIIARPAAPLRSASNDLQENLPISVFYVPSAPEGSVDTMVKQMLQLAPVFQQSDFDIVSPDTVVVNGVFGTPLTLHRLTSIEYHHAEGTIAESTERAMIDIWAGGLD